MKIRVSSRDRTEDSKGGGFMLKPEYGAWWWPPPRTSGARSTNMGVAAGRRSRPYSMAAVAHSSDPSSVILRIPSSSLALRKHSSVKAALLPKWQMTA